MKRLQTFIAVIAVLVPSTALQAEIIRVPADRPTIQAGIDAAADGDTVLVADGTYTGEGNRDISFGGKAITVASENGPKNCIVDIEGSLENPHLGFYFYSGEGEGSIVEGFTIRNGFLLSPLDDPKSGAGINCSGSSPTIRNNIITQNHSVRCGGGISCHNQCSPVITGNTISLNTTGGSGGGIKCTDGSSPVIRNNMIRENTANGGGAIACVYSGAAEITGNTIAGNEGTSGGGGILCFESSALIANNNITGNQGLYGGGLECHGSAAPRISGNLIAGNSAGFTGGGLHLNRCSPEITDCIIIGNRTDDDGGGMSLFFRAAPIVTNCLIAWNRAGEHGGGLDFLSLSEAAVTITNCTITGNQASYSGGGVQSHHALSTISNSILWGNSPDEITVWDGDPPAVTWSDVEGGYPGSGNIDADPLFVHGPLGDCFVGQVSAGQMTDSPCLDAGGDQAGNICFTSAGGTVCLDELATRTDGQADTGPVDIGFHYHCPDMHNASLDCQPTSGTLPFTVQLEAGMTNNSPAHRTYAGRIDWTLAGGPTFFDWRSGYTTVAPGSNRTFLLPLPLPAHDALIGPNLAQFHMADVTPAPYNQPPNPPSGDINAAVCTVTGIAP